MAKEKEVKGGQEPPLTSQLSMFVGDEPGTSNTIELVDTAPMFAWKRRNYIRDLEDGQEVRQFKHRGSVYELKVNGALIERKLKNKKTEKVLVIPSVREDYVFDALKRIAYSGGARDFNNEAGVVFTLRQLRKELSETGHSLTLSQIKESLKVLNTSHVELSPSSGASESIGGTYLSSLYLTSREDYVDNPQDAFCYATFHPLVTQSIKKQTYRLYDYEKAMSITSELGRHIFKRMSHNFVQAASDKTYDFRLNNYLESTPRGTTTVKADSRAMRIALNVLIDHHVITHFDDERVKSAKDKRVTVDVKYRLYPHPEFISQAIKANSRAKENRIESERIMLRAGLAPAKKEQDDMAGLSPLSAKSKKAEPEADDEMDIFGEHDKFVANE